MLIDVVRGIAISLVAFGHTNEGLNHRGWWAPSTLGLHIDSTIYSFHMPAFFFVSGIFLIPGVEKRGLARYTAERVRTILYPYLLWAVLTLILQRIFASFILHANGTEHFFRNLLTGDNAWFFPTLFLSLLAGALLVGPRRWVRTLAAGRATLLTSLFLAFLFVAAVAAQLLMPQVHAADIDLMFRHLPFLILGMAVGQSFEAMARVPRWLSALVACGLGALLIGLTGANHFGDRPWVVPLGILGTAMLLFLANALGRGAVARAFAWAGEASLGIFLISAYLQGFGRELLVRGFHTIAPWPQLLVPSILAIVIPAWLYQHRMRLHIGWLFVWPFAWPGQRKAA